MYDPFDPTEEELKSQLKHRTRIELTDLLGENPSKSVQAKYVIDYLNDSKHINVFGHARALELAYIAVQLARALVTAKGPVATTYLVLTLQNLADHFNAADYPINAIETRQEVLMLQRQLVKTRDISLEALAETLTAQARDLTQLDKKTEALAMTQEAEALRPAIAQRQREKTEYLQQLKTHAERLKAAGRTAEAEEIWQVIRSEEDSE